MRTLRLLLPTLLILLALPTAAPAHPHGDHHRARPLVIGHRGASGYRPEHTLASYRLAAVGPWKNYIIPRTADDCTGKPTSFITDAHDAGLVVHPYTFRRENAFTPCELDSSTDPAGIGDLVSEIRQFIRLGVDGFFTDNADYGVRARS